MLRDLLSIAKLGLADESMDLPNLASRHCSSGAAVCKERGVLR